MKFLKNGWMTAVLASSAMALSAWGQAPGRVGGAGGAGGFQASVAELFGNATAFSAMVEAGLTNQADGSRLTVPMRMHKSRERIRLDVNLQQLQGAGTAMQGLSALQGLGMTRMTCLVLPEEKGMILMFPDLKVGTRVAFSETALPTDGFRIAKRPAGKETAEGQASVRQDVTITTSDGTRVEGTTWEATALKGFPVRMLFRPEGSAMGLRFSQVRLAAQGDELFRVPTDVRIVDGAAGLMQEAMSRALQSGALGR